MNIVVKIIQGALIGAGGVLPGVSGGVLAVLFGLYKPLMRFLAHPIKNLKSSIIELWPILLGYAIGYVGREPGKSYEVGAMPGARYYSVDDRIVGAILTGNTDKAAEVEALVLGSL